ncbi:C40 family peptidase [Cohnella herbarum]|uniref:C40 family peptidase n=1 Tax=Cohnella herbarum TaxID=2728023 RepID=A0A7Z2ZLU7_9BACL|nr:C40 family peptidase [Cohnella herbarum]QJD84274.1 C40 family peptidase [Cohnella herbarum]
MKKQLIGFCASALLVGGLSMSSIPAVSAASPAVPSKHKGSSASIERNADGDHNQNNDTTNSNAGNSNSNTYNEGTQQSQETNNGITDNGQASKDIEKVIADGMKYEGTPYEFGSNRSTTATFDCSDFIRWIFKETLGITLPADSRQQGAYVKENGTAQTDWKTLKRGDLMFFMTYQGSSESDYKGVDKSAQRITHVGIYLGDGKILHTYSNASGGVHVGEFANTQWEHRFLFGGSVLPKQ